MAGPLIPLLVAGTEIASSVFSFTAAAKEREKERNAKRDAAKAIAEARKKLEVNYFKGLNLSREAYDLEFEKMAVFGTSALQAGTEGDQRGVGAVVGRVGQMIAEQAKQQRVDMAKEMTAFKVAVAKEETDLQKMKVALDVGEAVGAQKAAQDAAVAARYNTQQGLQQAAKGVSGVLTSGLFDKKNGDPDTGDSNDTDTVSIEQKSSGTNTPPLYRSRSSKAYTPSGSLDFSLIDWNKVISEELDWDEIFSSAISTKGWGKQ